MNEDYQTRLAAWEKARFAPPPDKPYSPSKPSQTLMVPMRDGVRLYAEIFLPSTPGCFPVVLLRSPYPYSLPSKHDKRPVSRYLQEKYAVVFQLTRGQGQSEGEYRLFIDDIDDGYDTIEWIAQQPWCDGNVGMEGSSYLGSTQLLAAKTKPPALKCIMPTAFVGNRQTCFPYSYGVPNKAPYMQWHQVLDVERWEDLDVNYCDMNALHHPKWGPAFMKRPLLDAADDVLSGDKLKSWREAMSSALDNEFWKAGNFSDAELQAMDLPMFFTDGWYDATIGPIDFFSRLEKLVPGRSDRYLLVGPWDHYQTNARTEPSEHNGDRALPDNGHFDHVDVRIKFFDRYLKQQSDMAVLEDRVRVYITGANVWRNYPTFPVPGTKQLCLYLHSQGDARSFPGDGVLSPDAPDAPGAEPVDQYQYDPALPTASMMESANDRRNTEIRSDVLIYTTERLTTPLTILGDIVLVLHAASDGLDTDWFAVLTEVFPDGQSKSFHYAPPAFRARYRKGFDEERLLTPNKAERYDLPMGPAGHQIPAGHRLRLSIFSAAFPEYDPNSNTGACPATDTGSRMAMQTVFHDAEKPSHVVLPVIELD